MDERQENLAEDIAEHVAAELILSRFPTNRALIDDLARGFMRTHQHHDQAHISCFVQGWLHGRSAEPRKISWRLRLARLLNGAIAR